MPRKNNHNDERVPQPTWEDVAMLLEALEAHYARHVEVSIDREGARGVGKAMWVYAKAYQDWTTVCAPTDVVRSLWPSLQHKTMVGMMVRLLHQLDHAMDARLKERASEEEDARW
jgi:hypothetical protein